MHCPVAAVHASAIGVVVAFVPAVFCFVTFIIYFIKSVMRSVKSINHVLFFLCFSFPRGFRPAQSASSLHWPGRLLLFLPM